MILLIFIDFKILYKMPICSRSSKMAAVRAEKKIDLFKIQDFDFLNESHFKGIFELSEISLMIFFPSFIIPEIYWC